MKKLKFVFPTFSILLILIFLFFFHISCNKAKPFKKQATSSFENLPEEKTPLHFDVVTQKNPSFPSNELLISFNSPVGEVNSIKNTVVSIEPQIKHKLLWEDEKTLKIKVLQYPNDPQDVSITIEKLPKGKEKFLNKNSFKIKFPPFKVVNIFPFSVSSFSFKVKIAFNYPVFLEELKNKIKLLSEGRELQFTISTLSSKNPSYLFVIEVNEPPRKNINLKLNEELTSANGLRISGKLEFNLNIATLKRSLYVSFYKIKETKNEFIVLFKATSQGEKPLISAPSLKGKIFVFPQIPINVSTSENYIFIKGKFLPSKKYSFLFLSGIKDIKGAFLEKELSFNIKIPERKGELVFLYKGKYFGKKRGLKIPISISNLKSLEVETYYMPKENVLFWYSQGYGENYSFDEYAKLFSRNKFEFKNRKNNLFFVDLSELIEEIESGIYMIYARGKTYSGRTLSDKIKITITDISLIAKKSRKYLHIWALDSSTLSPEKGVKINAKDRKNFSLGECFTNSSGYCRIPLKKKSLSPFIVFAQKDDEWSYMEIEDSQIPLASFNVKTSTTTEKKNYVFGVFLERDLIRPSEELNFSVVARKYGKLTGVKIPIRVKIRDPKGKIEKIFSKKTDSSGLALFKFKTNPISPTGKYAIEIYLGEKLYYTEFFFVETFAPERLLVDLKLRGEIENDTIPFHIKAIYLFGEPAGNETLNGKIVAKEFSPKCYGFSDYHFGKLHNEREKTFYIKDKKLNDNGEIDFDYYMDNLNFTKPLLLNVEVNISEGGSGRVTKRSKTFEYYREPYYVGLKNETQRLEPKKPYIISGILIKKGCELFKKNVELYYSIYEVNYYYSYYYSRRFNWERNVERIPVETDKKISIKNGKFKISFYPEHYYKSYLIELKDSDGKTKAQLIARGFWFSDEKPENPQVLKIETDKNECFEGETVKAKTNLPFEGKILWSIELDSLYKYKLKSAKGRFSEFEFKCPNDVSNIYISALLIKKDKNYLIERAFGIKELRIKKKKLNLKLKIVSPKIIKPQKEYSIKIYGKGYYKAIISIADEGVLNITGYDGLALYSTLLSPVGLFIQTSDTFGWIVKKFMTGGGMEEELAMSVPKRLKRNGLKMLYGKEKGFSQPRFTKIVSLWSGVLKSNSKGVIEYKFKVPEYQGRLKIMVLALTDNKLSTYTREITVKRDVYITATIPRFLYSGDEFKLPVLVVNTTKAKKDVLLRVSGDLVNDEKGFALAPEEKKILYFYGKAEKFMKKARIVVETITKKEKFVSNYSIPIYPSIPYRIKTYTFHLKPGEILNLKDHYNDWVKEGLSSLIIVSPFRGAEILTHLSFVLDYPYGCLEQTATKLLLYSKLKSFIKYTNSSITEDEIANLTHTLIGRVLSMQTLYGGFSFWPVSERVHDWGTAYALFSLIKAKDEGYYVPDSAITGAREYLRFSSKKSPFIYYVLTLAYKDPSFLETKLLSYKPKKFKDYVWLSLALKNTGSIEKAVEYLKKAFDKGIDSERDYSYDFYSPLKAKAILLYAVEKILNDKKIEERLLDEISAQLSSKGSFYYTTQELSWSLLALSEYAKKYGKIEDVKAELIADSKNIKLNKNKGIIVHFIENPEKYNQIYLKNTGDNDIVLTLRNSGFYKKERGFIKEVSGFDVSSSLLDLKKERVLIAKTGKVYEYYVFINSDGYYKNVAIEIPIPAGFEVENPRIRGKSQENGFFTHYVDVRDDRVIMFTDLKKGMNIAKIKIRAVISGKFLFPQVNVISMYAPTVYGRSIAKEIIVKN